MAMADGYDPEYWDDLVMQAMMRHWENPPSIEKGAQMDAETAPIYAAWRRLRTRRFRGPRCGTGRRIVTSSSVSYGSE